MNFIRTIIGLPLVIILVAFAAINSEKTDFDLWPFYIEPKAVSLGLATVFFVLLGYIWGRLDAWLANSSFRKQLRDQKRQNKKLSVEQVKLNGTVATLKDNLATAEKEKNKAKKEGAYSFLSVEKKQSSSKTKVSLKDKFKNLFKRKPQEDDFWCL